MSLLSSKTNKIINPIFLSLKNVKLKPKTAIFAFVVVGISMFGLWKWYAYQTNQAMPPIVASQITVQRREVVATIKAQGKLISQSQYNGYFRQAGTVTGILVKEGDVVQNKTQLARATNQPIETSAQKTKEKSLTVRKLEAQITLDQAIITKRDLENTVKDTLNTGTTEEKELAKLKLNHAQLQIDAALEEVNSISSSGSDGVQVLTSSIRGTVVAVNAKVGQETTSQDGKTNLKTSLSEISKAAIVVMDLQRFKTVLEVSEYDIHKVKLGQTADISIPSLKSPLVGTISYISKVSTYKNDDASSADGSSTSNTYSVEVSFELPKELETTSTVRPGMIAQITLMLEKHPNVLAVPHHAIQLDQQGQPTVTLVEGDQTRTVVVTTGLVGDELTEITDGVSEGQIISLPDMTSTTN
jgi:multidrug efflux pump subunit AcrA (membrane-fusion protein)